LAAHRMVIAFESLKGTGLSPYFHALESSGH
jgi:hypothetical protein